ncbi:MAG TPA: twin transmembrane helix small protein [Steroidobacteraceae bacterium]|jgi:hypothetical protein|nr:twin transmembrane helix small protein [Steroidobacteraceae bacterium]
MQVAVILLLIAIVASLGRALAAMASGPAHSAEMARALTWRISLSVGLFVLLFVGYHFGWIEPHRF